MTRISPELRAQIGDELADALDLPTVEQRAAAILAMDRRPEQPAGLPEAATCVRIETDRQRADRLRRGG